MIYLKLNFLTHFFSVETFPLAYFWPSGQSDLRSSRVQQPTVWPRVPKLASYPLTQHLNSFQMSPFLNCLRKRQTVRRFFVGLPSLSGCSWGGRAVARYAGSFVRKMAAFWRSLTDIWSGVWSMGSTLDRKYAIRLLCKRLLCISSTRFFGVHFTSFLRPFSYIWWLRLFWRSSRTFSFHRCLGIPKSGVLFTRAGLKSAILLLQTLPK